MNIFTVSIYVCRGKAYIPFTLQSEFGFFIGSGPISVVNIDNEEIKNAVEKVLLTRNKDLHATQEDVEKAGSWILQATGISSWRKLAQVGTVYTLSWDDEKICIYMSKLDKKSRWINDPQKTKELPLDTPLEVIVAIILDDVNSRPELKDENFGGLEEK